MRPLSEVSVLTSALRVTMCANASRDSVLPFRGMAGGTESLREVRAFETGSVIEHAARPLAETS